MKDSDGAELQVGDHVTIERSRRVGEVVEAEKLRVRVRWPRDGRLPEESWLVMGRGLVYRVELEERHVCAVCNQPMTVNGERVEICVLCKEPEPQPHVHIRCASCSPPGWWGVVKQ